MASRSSSELIGRSEELVTLRDALTRSADGEAATVFVAGEAGVGKTRLATEAAHRAEDEGARVLTGECLALAEGELPFAPLVAALRPLLRELPPGELERIPGNEELGRLLPELGGAAEDRFGGGSALQEPLAQSRLFEVMLRLLSHLGEKGPVVLLIEDLHWADRSTRDFISFLIRNGRGVPLMVVCTYRSDELHRTHPLRAFLADAIAFPRINADGTITYLDANAFLAAIGAGSASVTIQDIDGDPSFPFNVLEVTNGTLTDQGGGVARLTIGTGSGGGGGTWGSITGTLSSQTDLQTALDARQPLDQDLTEISVLSTQAFGRSLLTMGSPTAAVTLLGAQASDADLDDLADGSLTGSKIGTGINAANITTGTLALARGGLNADVSGYVNGLYGQLSSVTADVDTIGEFSTALGITGTPSTTTVLRGDGVWTTAPGAITVMDEDGTPTVSTVTQIRVTNGALTDNGAGSVSLNLSGGAGGGDAISDISSSTSQQITLFNGTTGKHLTNFTGTGIISAASGVIGTVTNSAGLAAGLSDETGSGAAVFASGPTFTSPQLGAASASSLTSPIFQSSSGDTADAGCFVWEMLKPSPGNHLPQAQT